MTDEKAPESAPSSDTEATAPQPAGGWDAQPPEAAAAPPPAWPSTDAAATDAAATPPPAASPTPLAPLVAPTPPPAVPPPAYTPQPAVAWQAAPAVAVAGGRSGLAAGAGIGLLVFGILLLLIGLLFFAVAGMVGGLAESGGFGDIPGMPPGMEGAIGGFVVVFGIIVILYSLVYIIGGIGVLRSRNWGRVMGIVVGIITGLLMLSGLTTPSTTGDQSSLIFSLILLALHVYIVVALAFFWKSKPATA